MFKKSKILPLLRKNLEDAQCLGVAIRNSGLKSYTTIERWRKRALIDRYIKRCIEKSNDRRDNAVVDSLFKQAIDGNPTCIAIYLKFKMGWKDSPQMESHISNVVVNVKELSADKVRTESRITQ